MATQNSDDDSVGNIHGNGVIGSHDFENDQPDTTSKYAISKQIMPESGGANTLNARNGCGGEEMTNKRQRRSRWDRPVESDCQNGDALAIKKRKSRWADDGPTPLIQLPEFIGGIEFDPEIQQLNSRLLEISRILQSGMPLDDRPEGIRSPSPEPLYDNMGIRINTREYRAREKLNCDRQMIISQIIKKNPSFRPPSDYRPPKLYKKLNIPKKEYPGYNFIGLIIGPRGNTQKRMEKETGAKIVIRGKGSMKEGRLQQKRDWKPDPSDNEELHVLVEADTQESLDAAAGMVEKLLQPVDEVLNEHKRLQLRELASLNGTIRAEEFCRLCGETGHRQYACPSRSTTFKSDVLCKICGDGGHPTIDCPVKGSMKGSSGTVMDDEYRSFLAELGGSLPESATEHTSTFAILASGTTSQMDDGAVNASHPGLGFIKEYDETNLYVGYLPPNIDDDGLIKLFSPFGDIVMTRVIKDKLTGVSKGYGFVKYADIQQANSAISKMNGHCLEGRTIAVRIAGKPPQPALPPGPPPVSTMATYLPPSSSVLTFSSHQFNTNASPGNYIGAHVPWAPSVHPPELNTYTGFQKLPMMTCAAQYPSFTSTIAISSAEESQTFPPGMKPESSVSGQYGNSYLYGKSMPSMQLSVHSSFPSSSFGYPSYFVPPPLVPYPASVDNSQVMANAPWNSKPLLPLSVMPAEKPAFVTDTEYEKFMAEMK